MMGIFPTSFVPKHMIHLRVESHSLLRENILSFGFDDECIILELYQEKNILIEIDHWVKENMRSYVYYCEDWPEDAPGWRQCFYFLEQEDLVAFKLRWV